jgi:NADH-quinone oxidoreductase subunit N
LGSLGLISLGSLAGIPPLGGFIGKLLLFWVAYQAGLFSLLAVAIIGVVISIYYYFGWLRAIVLRPEGSELVENPSDYSPLLLSEKCFFISLLTLVVILGLFPGLLLNLI